MALMEFLNAVRMGSGRLDEFRMRFERVLNASMGFRMRFGMP